MSSPLVLALCIASGAFYVAAAAVLKLGSGLPFLLLLLPVYGILGLAAWFESMSLAENRFGVVVLVILGSEVVITAVIALTLGERYGPRELAGLGMIILGMAAVFGGEGSHGERAPATVQLPAPGAV